MENEKKAIEYAAIITEHLAELFDEENESGTAIRIDDDEFDANAFFYAISTLVPASIFKQITKQNIDGLAFNHLANRLCFQFGKTDK